jgi:hypothetical protein
MRSDISLSIQRKWHTTLLRKMYGWDLSGLIFIDYFLPSLPIKMQWGWRAIFPLLWFILAHILSLKCVYNQLDKEKKNLFANDSMVTGSHNSPTI